MSVPLIKAFLSPVPSPPVPAQALYCVVAFNIAGSYWRIHGSGWNTRERAESESHLLASCWRFRHVVEIPTPGLQLDAQEPNK